MWDERWLARALLEFTDTLGSRFDEDEFAQRLSCRCGELTGVGCTGVALAAPKGGLRLAAASEPVGRMLHAVQVRYGQGPALTCYHSGRTVHVGDLTAMTSRWPAFAAAVGGAGFRGVHAVPLRRHDVGVGTVSLYLRGAPDLTPRTAGALEALAAAAAVGILQQRSRRNHEVLARQLQEALDRRIVVEQAKGMLAERLSVDPQEAFERLRAHARRYRRTVHGLAAAIVDTPAGPDLHGLTLPNPAPCAVCG
ncbi:GAF and ANTAR domain-containing protein [Pseudonocardia sp. RS11V-5]|uniref:GAF and ANTAR domain-containing protein n=1 Tax=Pseudonocardia terrae TaxID=2905831 RepID=UPI001E2CAD94|nr:GAF and ANTAR domain-containing protein [Pseudonocardia terrae]MCE3553032.1 GAF and ANTAR domain-containing protein [Pseudonocardia terrae]